MTCWIGAELSRTRDDKLVVGVTVSPRPRIKVELDSIQVCLIGHDDVELGQPFLMPVAARLVRALTYTLRFGHQPKPARVRCVAKPLKGEPLVAVFEEPLQGLAPCSRVQRPGGLSVSPEAKAHLEAICAEVHIEECEAAFQMFVDDLHRSLPGVTKRKRVERIFRELMRPPLEDENR